MPKKTNTPFGRIARQIARQERQEIAAFVHQHHPVYTPESQVNTTAIFTSDRSERIERQIEAAGNRRIYFELYDCSTDRWSAVFADTRRGGAHGITASYFQELWDASLVSLANFLLSHTGDGSSGGALDHACLIRLYVIGGQTQTERDRQYLANAAAAGFWKPAKSLDRYSADSLHRKAAGLRSLEASGNLGRLTPTEVNRYLRGHGVTPEHPGRKPRPAVRIGRH